MSTDGFGGYAVVVPIRSLKTGKSRLLTDSDALRRELALAFFLDAVAALEGSDVVDRIVVVSDDATIRQLTPARVRRGFPRIRATMPNPAGAPKPSRPGPGRPPGSRNRRPAHHHHVGKRTKIDITEPESETQPG
ncbi:hypothetical protein [Rhodococcus opacus]|uniref:hypothetical protein n=1 Tax=Rhodococcus opacus TaxID=37919 RepID=UPI0029547300|nr:hypothetical protein [Rhodococcus opacus]MDV7091043.1 hypothetical protein [Rhodococcus opacus]